MGSLKKISDVQDNPAPVKAPDWKFNPKHTEFVP